MIYNFRIFGDPVSQGRPRFFVRKKGGVGCEDPAKSKDWKQNVINQILVSNGRPEKFKFIDGPITLTLNFFMPRPKSLPKKVKHHIKRPDLDNLVKAIKDALSGLLYKDDSQIIELIATKEYCKIRPDGYYEDPPGVSIRLYEVIEDEIQKEE